MRRPALFVVTLFASLACLDVALGRVSHGRGGNDALRQEDLQQFYQQIDRESFAGKLPDVPVRWGDLTKEDAYGITHFESGVPYAMELDRHTVHSKSFAMDVIRHESCHIATNREAKQRKENPHGAAFVACMARIQDSEQGE